MKQKNKDLIWVAASALLLGLARLPWHLGFLCFAGFVPLLFFFQRQPDSAKIFKAALVFSLVYTITALHWITLVTIPGFAGMIILFTLYFWILFTLNSICCKKNYHLRYLCFILLWLTFEHLQNFGQFAFPWFYSAYSLADYTFILQPAELGGVSLISLFILITNVLIFEFIISQKRSVIVALFLIHLIWTGGSIWRYHTLKLHPAGKKAGIVQASIPQDVKWKPAWRDTTFALYHQYTAELSDDTGLVILPESAIPGYVLKGYIYKSFVNKLIRKHHKAVLTGFPDYKYLPETDQRFYYNACSYFDSTHTYHPPYYKKILVPFGERIPLLAVVPILNKIELGQANWEYGDSLRYYNYEGLKFTPQICFEVAFPYLNVQMAKQNPIFIANLTNDAWFHYSAGTYQHAVMTRFRAIETRTQYFRSANTGYSMIVDPRGDILAKTELFSRQAIEAEIYDYSGQSPFVRGFYLFPHILSGLCALILLYTLLKN